MWCTKYYNNLLQYISEQIGMPVHYIQKESYKEVNELLAQGAVDFAFICSGAYIEAKKQGTINLLVAPLLMDWTPISPMLLPINI